MNLYELLCQEPKEKKLINLVAGGGTGKTHQIVYAYKSFLQNMTKHGIIPIYVPVNQYDGETTSFIHDYILKNYLKYKYGESDSKNRNKLEEMIRETAHSYIIFIDSINEISVYPHRLYSEIKNLSKLNNLSVIVASRNEISSLHEFRKINLKKLDDSYIENRIESFISLNNHLKELLRVPFYLYQYLKIQKDYNDNITSAAELLNALYKWMIDKNAGSIDEKRYSNLCDVILYDFLPEFTFEQYKKFDFMMIKKKELLSCWKKFKEENEIKSEKDCITILEDFRIIFDFDDETYIYAHQDIFNFFIALYLYKGCSFNFENIDKKLECVTSKDILKMCGELLGEHKFREKTLNIKSPIEKILDRYRGYNSDDVAKVISQYVEMMSLSRGICSCSNLQNLDMSMVDFSFKKFNHTNFDRSLISTSNFNNQNITLSEKVKSFLINEGEMIVSVDESGYISLINFKNNCRDDVVLTNEKVIDAHMVGDEIAVFTENKIIIYSVTNDEKIKEVLFDSRILGYSCELNYFITETGNYMMCIDGTLELNEYEEIGSDEIKNILKKQDVILFNNIFIKSLIFHMYVYDYIVAPDGFELLRLCDSMIRSETICYGAKERKKYFVHEGMLLVITDAGVYFYDNNLNRIQHEESFSVHMNNLCKFLFANHPNFNIESISHISNRTTALVSVELEQTNFIIVEIDDESIKTHDYGRNNVHLSNVYLYNEQAILEYNINTWPPCHISLVYDVKNNKVIAQEMITYGAHTGVSQVLISPYVPEMAYVKSGHLIVKDYFGNKFQKKMPDIISMSFINDSMLCCLCGNKLTSALSEYIFHLLTIDDVTIIPPMIIETDMKKRIKDQYILFYNYKENTEEIYKFVEDDITSLRDKNNGKVSINELRKRIKKLNNIVISNRDNYLCNQKYKIVFWGEEIRVVDIMKHKFVFMAKNIIPTINIIGSSFEQVRFVGKERIQQTIAANGGKI